MVVHIYDLDIAGKSGRFLKHTSKSPEQGGIKRTRKILRTSGEQ